MHKEKLKFFTAVEFLPVVLCMAHAAALGPSFGDETPEAVRLMGGARLNETMTRDGRTAVDVHAGRYPFAVVWGPLPGLTCCCPCVGHLGIADSQGRIHDFQGPYAIGVDDFMVGMVWRYAVVSSPEDLHWDEGIAKADAEYSTRVHDICCENCHHHVAMALTESGRPQWGDRGLLSSWLLCCLHGRCTWC